MDFRSIACSGFLAAALLAGTAQARELSAGMQVSASVSGEEFRWKDFNSQGGEVARERGSRAGVALALNNHQRSNTGFIFGVDLESLQGTVEYNGDAWTGVIVPAPQQATVMTETKSSRTSAGVNGGIRIVMAGVGLNLLAGLRYETWTREISDGVSTAGSATYGHTEEYAFNHGRLSVGLSYATDRFHVGITAVKIYPDEMKRTVTLDAPTSNDVFAVKEDVERADFVMLSGGFSGTTFRLSSRHRFEFGIYHSQIKTRAASAVYVTPRGTAYLQPGIDVSSLGVQAGYGFQF